MSNRCLYGLRGFRVSRLECYVGVWHLIGTFVVGSIKSSHPKREYHVRVKPDPRWENVKEVAFHPDRVYECESVAYYTRRHVYGSGKWYVSPYREKGEWRSQKEEFIFEDFDVTQKGLSRWT